MTSNWKLLTCILFLWNIDSIRTLCRIYNEQSPNSVSRVNWNQRGYEQCCINIYTILYKYIECHYEKILTKNTLESLGEATIIFQNDKDNQNDYKIEEDQNQILKYLIFINSHIPLIPAGVFVGISNVTQLFLNNSAVETIQPGAFMGLSHLERLQLEKNLISEISRETFNSLGNLRTLNVANNRINNLEENSLMGLFNLEYLLINNNEMEHLPSNMFYDLKSLIFADLSHNHIRNIHPGAFSGVSNLEKLQFENRSQSEISRGTFNSLGNLRILNISNNRINNLEENSLWELFKLEYLVINNNELERLPSNMFYDLKSLILADLSHNHIRNIHPGAFSGLSNLEKLQLENNFISDISRGTFNSLGNLRILNISNNRINNLEENSLLGLFKLEYLLINNNELERLPSNMFHGLKSLIIADLSHNRIKNISENLFSEMYDNNSSLSDIQIDLSYNQITSVNFSYFPVNTKILDLSNNKINTRVNLDSLLNIQILDLSVNDLSNLSFASSELQYFNMSGNKLQKISKGLFRHSKLLISLDLSYNLLLNLEEDSLIGLENLTNLYLQNNELFHITIGCFRELYSLRFLNLSGNSITTFEYGTFTGLVALETIDISNNVLSNIDEGVFLTLHSMKYLNLNNNLLTKFDAAQLLSYAKTLNAVSLNNNPWNCKVLLKIYTVFHERDVNISEGSSKKLSNVHGIGCFNYKFDRDEETTAINKTFDVFEFDDLKAKILTITKELELMKRFFNTDFVNTAFYKFFNNFTKSSTELNYKNEMQISEFLKQFGQILSNSNVSGQFKEITKDLEKLHEVFQNEISDSTKMTKQLSQYFNEGFENSGFYKYFNKNFLNSYFFKYFQKDAENDLNSNLIKINSRLSSLQSLFENSELRRFMQNNTTDRFNTLRVSNPETPFAKFTNNPKDEQNVQIITSKLADMLNTIITLLIIGVIILIVMLALFSLINIYNPIKFTSKDRSVTKKTTNTESNQELELL